MNTGPEQFLGLPQPLERWVEKLLEVAQVYGDAVGKRSLEMGPNEFVRVEFRSIARKAMGMQARVRFEKLLHHGSLMRSAAIPEQDHGTAQMFEQLPEELDHFRGTDVFVAMESGVEGKAPSSWGNADG